MIFDYFSFENSIHVHGKKIWSINIFVIETFLSRNCKLNHCHFDTIPAFWHNVDIPECSDLRRSKSEWYWRLLLRSSPTSWPYWDSIFCSTIIRKRSFSIRSEYVHRPHIFQSDYHLRRLWFAASKLPSRVVLKGDTLGKEKLVNNF